MTAERKLIIRLLDMFINGAEIDMARILKNRAIDEQKYEEAANYRDTERKLCEKIPTLEDFKKIRDEFKSLK